MAPFLHFRVIRLSRCTFHMIIPTENMSSIKAGLHEKYLRIHVSFIKEKNISLHITFDLKQY